MEKAERDPSSSSSSSSSSRVSAGKAEIRSRDLLKKDQKTKVGREMPEGGMLGAKGSAFTVATNGLRDTHVTF